MRLVVGTWHLKRVDELGAPSRQERSSNLCHFLIDWGCVRSIFPLIEGTLCPKRNWQNDLQACCQSNGHETKGELEFDLEGKLL